MTEIPYTKRELDMKFDGLHETLEEHGKTHVEILEEVKKTNGKVKKIIIAMVLLFGMTIGYSVNNWSDIIQIFI